MWVFYCKIAGNFCSIMVKDYGCCRDLNSLSAKKRLFGTSRLSSIILKYSVNEHSY